jgi:hypothetical protein
VLRGTREARENGEADEAKAREEVEAQAARLSVGRARMEELRGTIAAPVERVRVAQA